MLEVTDFQLMVRSICDRGCILETDVRPLRRGEISSMQRLAKRVRTESLS